MSSVLKQTSTTHIKEHVEKTLCSEISDQISVACLCARSYTVIQ